MNNGKKCKAITEEEANEITLDSKAVEKVQEFVFLGSVVPGTSSDIKRRIALASIAFEKLKYNIWSRKSIPLKLKIRLYYSLIVPIAIYASETWSHKIEDCRRLQVFENNCLRTLLGIRLIDHVRITDIYIKGRKQWVY